MRTERVDTAVIGAGQAGLAAAYHLARQGDDYVILDSHDRVGDSWRKRWDSLRLFTPTSFNQLPGMPFPKSVNPFPTKDEMADYLESYAARFQFPILQGTKVNELQRDGDRYLVAAGERVLKADRVIVATGAYPTPRIPTVASQLDANITQLHSVAYRNPDQLPDGAVLVVGAGNSGVEIALDLAPRHPVLLAGRDTGFIPANFDSGGYQVGTVLFRALTRRLTVDTPPGRWLERRARQFSGGHPVIGITRDDLRQAGIERVPRVTGVSQGRPLLEDGRVLDVAVVIWATGFVRDYRWIKLPVFDPHGEPIHHRGVVPTEPGLYFVGLPFQTSLLSGLVAGAGDDAAYVVNQIARRARGAGTVYEKRHISHGTVS